METFYSYNSYRYLVRDAVKQKRTLIASFTAQRLAEKIGVQKSYLSKVFSLNAHLSTDQLFLIAKELKWNKKETDYAFLLLEYERSGIEERRTTIFKKIEAQQKEHLKIKNTVQSDVSLQTQDLKKYYLNPLVQIVHTFLYISEYSNNQEKLKKHLQISQEQFDYCLETLKELKLIEIKNKKIIGIPQKMHLPQDSIYFQPWSNQVKTLVMHKQLVSQNENDYEFNVFFTANPEAQKKIRTAFLEFLEKTQSLVEQAPSKSVYHMGFNIMNW